MQPDNQGPIIEESTKSRAGAFALFAVVVAVGVGVYVAMSRSPTDSSQKQVISQRWELHATLGTVKFLTSADQKNDIHNALDWIAESVQHNCSVAGEIKKSIRVIVEIRMDGQVANALLTEADTETDVPNCLTQTVMKQRFPKTRKAIKLEATYNLESVAEIDR